MRTQVQKGSLIAGILLMAGAIAILALGTSMPTILAGIGLTGLAAICFYTSGEEDGKHQRVENAKHQDH